MFKKNYYILFLCSLLFSVNEASGTSHDEIVLKSYENNTLDSIACQSPDHCNGSTDRDLKIFFNKIEQFFNESKSAPIPYNASLSSSKFGELGQQIIEGDQEDLIAPLDTEANIISNNSESFLNTFNYFYVNSEDVAANFDDLPNIHNFLIDTQVNTALQSTSPLKIKISKAQVEDSEELAAVHVLAWFQSYIDILNKEKLCNKTNSKDYQNKRVEEHLSFISKTTSDSNYNSLAVKINNKIVGFCNFGPARKGNYSFENDNSKGEIYTLYLLDEVKGKGVGSKLYKKVDKILKKKELAPYKVWTLEDNEIARGFYKAKGGVLQKKTDDSVITKDIEIFEDHYNEVCYIFNQ